MKFNLLFSFLLMGIGSAISCTSSSSSGTTDSTRSEVTPSAPASVASFNSDSAMAYLKRQVDFGPRVPVSEAHRLCADWLASKLRAMGAKVDDATMHTRHPVTGADIAVRNIFAQFNPEASRRVLLLAHYDTRPWADEDSDPANHNSPIDGSNDGASGVAVALEIARLNDHLPAGSGLDILLTDVEDSGSYGNDESWCLGSNLWAQQLPYAPANLPRYAVLLDMVGGADAVFRREYFSELYAPQINDLVWNAARTSGHSDRFINEAGGAVNDDHLPLIRAGIPTVDIIETRNGGFNPTWHTVSDNFENIDPATLSAVGDVITHLIYNAK